MSEHRLDEILIERPRGGIRCSSRRLKGTQKLLNKLTLEASEDGLLNPYLIKVRNGSKYLSDHLGPLRRFLRTKVGQPWHQVYSELCQRLDTSTIAGQHVISHLWDYVERYVEIIDGIPYRKPHSRYYSSRLDDSHRDCFYVHPKTGLLCVAQKVARKRQDQPVSENVVIIDDYHQYRQINQLWYLVTFEQVPAAATDYVHDVLQGLIHCQSTMFMYGQRVYATRKKQCNKKEIRLIVERLAKRQ